MFATVRPYLRNIAQVPAALDGEIASTGFAVLRAAAGVIPSYLFYKSISRDFVAALTGEQYGVSYPAVKEDQVHAQSFELPPTTEQHRIVAKIEELFSELDKGVESLTTARENLKAYRQAVLKYAFEGRLTATLTNVDPLKIEAPSSSMAMSNSSQPWPSLPVSALLRAPLSNGRSVPDRSGGFPVLRLTALKHGRINLRESKEGDWDRSSAAPFLVAKGDFFIARGNGSKQLVGIGGLVTEVLTDVAFPDTMIRLRLDPEIVDLQYFSLCWNSRIVRQQIESHARTTAGIYKINQDHVSSIRLPVPSLAEQRRIVSLLDEKLTTTEFTIQQIDEQRLRADALRMSVLQKAFSGQLVPQDPNDEPAAVLLERIKAEKERSADNKPKPKKLKAQGAAV